MKEIVVISGKGGTGKTSLTAAFATLSGDDIVVADCDVDAADLHLLLGPDFAGSESFYSGQLAGIAKDVCTNCGECAAVCRFSAISIVDGVHTVDPMKCEGCGYCSRICKSECITMSERNVGDLYVSQTRSGGQMVHAQLDIGAENSGKLVARVKRKARQLADANDREFLLVDGSPGIGCPVVSSLANADFVVLVTESTLSGLHDLRRVYELVKRFKIPAGCIINKSDLNDSICSLIEEFLESENIASFARLPYDNAFTEAMTRGETIVEFDREDLRKSIETIWNSVKASAS